MVTIAPVKLPDAPPGRTATLLIRLHRTRCYPDHPFFLFWDIGILSGIALGWQFSRQADGLSFSCLAAWQLFMFALYEIAYLPLKARLLGVRTRSLSKDWIFFFIPMLVIGLWIAGATINVGGRFVGLWLPLVGGIQRLGCLVGGCCFGRPCEWGIRYPAIVFTHSSAHRRYRPDPDPHAAVSPLPLIESIFGLSFFAVFLMADDAVAGISLPLLFLTLYYCLRSVSDRYRWRVKDKRLGHLNVTDLLAVVFVSASVVYWCTTAFHNRG